MSTDMIWRKRVGESQDTKSLFRHEMLWDIDSLGLSFLSGSVAPCDKLAPT